VQIFVKVHFVTPKSPIFHKLGTSILKSIRARKVLDESNFLSHRVQTHVTLDTLKSRLNRLYQWLQWKECCKYNAFRTYSTGLQTFSIMFNISWKSAKVFVHV